MKIDSRDYIPSQGPVCFMCITLVTQDLQQNLTYFKYSRPRRKFRLAIEALFMINFPTENNKFSFYLDRKAKRGMIYKCMIRAVYNKLYILFIVTVDINSNSKLYSKYLDIPEMNETTTIRSLAILFKHNSLVLYIDCKEGSKFNLDTDISKLFRNLDEPTVKLVSFEMLCLITNSLDTKNVWYLFSLGNVSIRYIWTRQLRVHSPEQVAKTC